MGITAYQLSVLAGKTAVVTLLLLLLYRVLGKRNLAQFTAYDLVTLMAVANSVQNAMTAGRGELLVGMICSATLLLIAFGLSKLFVKAPGAQRVLLGIPVPLISDGVLLRDNMRREGVTIEELQTALRQHDVIDVSHADLAILEVDGSISVIRRGTASRIDSRFV